MVGYEPSSSPVVSVNAKLFTSAPPAPTECVGGRRHPVAFLYYLS
jgi:hypothetical protein